MNLKLSFEKNTIIVHNQDTYKGCDGEMYSYAATYVEGSGAEDVWNYIKYLENKVKQM
jgi:hypothetical protein